MTSWKRIPALGISPFFTFQSLHRQSGEAFLLESPRPGGPLERFSILGRGRVTKIPRGKNPFPILQETLRQGSPNLLPLAIPRFVGGLVGFLSYDAAFHLEKITQHAEDDLPFPQAAFFEAPEFILFDHREREVWIMGSTDNAVLRLEGFLEGRGKAEEIDFYPNIPIDLPPSSCTPQRFMEMVLRCKEYIVAGDIYQANLSQRFSIDSPAHPLDIYTALRKINPSPFAAYLDFGDFQLISCSPERLVLLEDGMAETRPIAGTRRRGIDFHEDEALTGELLLNEKERAEHLMLVDLERNDLGRVCEFGSVRVKELMIVEKYSHVMHIVSHVAGKRRRDVEAIQLFSALFPGGTITGCPKIRSMEIIEELEPVKRGPYTGCIGYMGWNGAMDMAITIRTILKMGNKCYVQAGAGIVADSDPECEYWETVYKAQAMLHAIRVASRQSVYV